MVLQRYDQDVPVKDLKFDRAMFWVQVHDIPIRYMSREVAASICESVGVVCRSNAGVEADGGRFIRVKVSLDISLPLCRGRLITLENGKKHWVSFKYERLPNICYWCGRLDHNDKDCTLWIQSKGSLTEENRQYNQTLRASPYRPQKSVIFVLGFYERAENTRTSSGVPTEDQAMPEFSGPSPSIEMNPVMETDMHEEFSNADATPDVSGSWADRDLTYEPQADPGFSSPSTVICQATEKRAIPKEDSPLLADLEAISKPPKSEMLPKNTGTFANGDPFLAKLQEIDNDIKKYDHDPRLNPSDLGEPGSGLDGLVAVQARSEEAAVKPLTAGPQENGPYLPKQEVNRPNMRLPLQDLSNSNGLPNKAKPKRIPKVQKPIVLSHWLLQLTLKKENTPQKILQMLQH